MHSHHSHSGAFCSHATPGTSPWTMVERAWEAGFTRYALTEHVPRALSEQLYPEEAAAGVGPSDLAATFRAYIAEARSVSQHCSSLSKRGEGGWRQTHIPADGSNKGAVATSTRLKSISSKAPMQVLVGAETENIDGRNNECLDFLAGVLQTEAAGDLASSGRNSSGPQYIVDFLVGSVHHVHGIPIDFDKKTFEQALQHIADENGIGTAAALEAHEHLPTHAHLLLIAAYLDAQHTLIARFQPEVIGHFDLCRLFARGTPMTVAASLLPSSRSSSGGGGGGGDQKLTFQAGSQISTDCLAKLQECLTTVDARVRRNIALAASYGALFEMNTASVRKGWTTPYPGEDVLDVILAHGGRLCLSDDAHSHEQVGLNYHVALEYLASKDVKTLWMLTKADGDEGASPSSSPEASRTPPTKFPRGTEAHPVPLSEFQEFVKRREEVQMARTADAPEL